MKPGWVESTTFTLIHFVVSSNNLRFLRDGKPWREAPESRSTREARKSFSVDYEHTAVMWRRFARPFCIAYTSHHRMYKGKSAQFRVGKPCPASPSVKNEKRRDGKDRSRLAASERSTSLHIAHLRFIPRESHWYGSQARSIDRNHFAPRAHIEVAPRRLARGMSFVYIFSWREHCQPATLTYPLLIHR